MNTSLCGKRHVKVTDATRDYEAWLGRHTALDMDDVEFKHFQMARPKNPFPFFRATYYRWVQLWPVVCPDLNSAPRVLEPVIDLCGWGASS
jgi:hypothetical protein